MARRLSAAYVRRQVLQAVSCLESMREPLRADPESPKVLHEYRKQTRRVDAAVQLTELYLTPVEFAKARSLTSDLADGLGGCRDADVAHRRLGRLAKGRSAPLKAQLQAVVDAAAVKGRKARIRKAVARARPRRLRKPLAKVLSKASPGALEPLALLRIRVGERAERVKPGASVQDLHAFRLELKAYRYAIEALASGPESPGMVVAVEAHEATESLGRIVDAHVLASLAETARPLAARTILAAARRDDQAARARFEAAWEGSQWPALKRDLMLPATP